MSKLPLGWVNTRLFQIALWGSGGTPSRRNMKNYDGGIPWLKTGELGPRVVYSTEETISEVGLGSSSAKLFPKGSVVVAMYGATIGKASILGIESATNQACAVGIPIVGMVTSEYLHFYLCSERENFINAGQGGAQPNISQRIIKDWPIPLAPFNEQKRIADKLDTLLARVDACRERLDRVPAILRRFRQSVLAAATSGKLTEDWRKKHCAIGDRTFDWKHVTVGDLCENSFYGPRFGKNEYTTKEIGIPTIRTTDMTDIGQIKITDDTPRVIVSSDKLEHFRVRRGDLLVTRTGSIGTMAIFEDNYLAIPGAYLIRFRFSHQVLPRYVFFCLMSPCGQEQLGFSSTAITQPNINAEAIKRIEIQLPCVDEQLEIIRRVESLFAYADQLEARYKAAREQVERLTPALLAKAFRGELVPQDPNDEPASVLLERIRTLRATEHTEKPKGRRGRSGAEPS